MTPGDEDGADSRGSQPVLRSRAPLAQSQTLRGRSGIRTRGSPPRGQLGWPTHRRSKLLQQRSPVRKPVRFGHRIGCCSIPRDRWHRTQQPGGVAIGSPVFPVEGCLTHCGHPVGARRPAAAYSTRHGRRAKSERAVAPGPVTETPWELRPRARKAGALRRCRSGGPCRPGNQRCFRLPAGPRRIPRRRSPAARR